VVTQLATGAVSIRVLFHVHQLRLPLVPVMFGGRDVPGPGVIGARTWILQFLSGGTVVRPTTFWPLDQGAGQVQTVLETAAMLVSVPIV
jgi:hypothetical protein